MDTPRPLQLPLAAGSESDALDTAVVDAFDVAAAIELVARGLARRVVLSGIPGAESLAAEALAAAQGAGVRFALSRDPETGSVSMVVGPRER